MSQCRYKRHRSRSHSRSSINKRESQQNRNKDRSTDYDRRTDSYERHHHSSEYLFLSIIKFFFSVNI
jgi:hypothetical protein